MRRLRAKGRLDGRCRRKPHAARSPGSPRRSPPRPRRGFGPVASGRGDTKCVVSKPRFTATRAPGHWRCPSNPQGARGRTPSFRPVPPPTGNRPGCPPGADRSTRTPRPAVAKSGCKPPPVGSGAGPAGRGEEGRQVQPPPGPRSRDTAPPRWPWGATLVMGRGVHPARFSFKAPSAFPTSHTGTLRLGKATVLARGSHSSVMGSGVQVTRQRSPQNPGAVGGGHWAEDGSGRSQELSRPRLVPAVGRALSAPV